MPEGATLQQVAAAGPAGMPVVQAIIDRSKGRHAIAYAFRPGESTVRYSYELPYTNNAASVKIPPSPWTANRLLVVAAPTIEVKADGLQSAGQEQGMNVYQISNLAPNATVAVNLSGTAQPLNAGSRSDQEQQGVGGGAEAPSAAPAAANIQAVPGRLDALKWPLLAGFLGVFAVCAVLLARKPVSVTVAGSSQNSELLTVSSENVSTERVAPSCGNWFAGLFTRAGQRFDSDGKRQRGGKQQPRILERATLPPRIAPPSRHHLRRGIRHRTRPRRKSFARPRARLKRA